MHAEAPAREKTDHTHIRTDLSLDVSTYVCTEMEAELQQMESERAKMQQHMAVLEKQCQASDEHAARHTPDIGIIGGVSIARTFGTSNHGR